MDQSLAVIESNLKRIAGRQLDANQKETLQQVHRYMEQAKAASKDDDLQRAQNLADKARLLSDELAKP